MKLHLKPPCLIFYRDDLGVSEEGLSVNGRAKGFCVWIRKDRENKGLYEHEYEHVRQFWRLGLLHMILLWSSSYREWVEREAEEKEHGT